MVFTLILTSVSPVYAQEVNTITPDVETVSTLYSSIEKVVDWMNAIYKRYQEQLEVEETEVRIERRQIKNEIKEVKFSLDPSKSVPLYNQLDYPDVQYGCCGTVASHGCGVAALAMVASYLLDDEITPDEMAKQFGEYNTEGGSKWALFEDSAEVLGLKLQERTNDTTKVMEALANNQVVISLQGPGLFTSGGHFIVLVGLTKDGKILVNDSNGRNYTKNKTLVDGFANGFTEAQVFRDGSPYWIYEKKEISNYEKTIILNMN